MYENMCNLHFLNILEIFVAHVVIFSLCVLLYTCGSEMYGRELVDLRKENRWEFLNTLFSVSEAVAYMQVVYSFVQAAL